MWTRSLPKIPVYALLCGSHGHYAKDSGYSHTLEVGYAGEEYHAWISTYIKDKGWINGIIEFDGTSWNMLDPTFASTSDSPKKFIAQKK